MEELIANEHTDTLHIDENYCKVVCENRYVKKSGVYWFLVSMSVVFAMAVGAMWHFSTTAVVNDSNQQLQIQVIGKRVDVLECAYAQKFDEISQNQAEILTIVRANAERLSHREKTWQ